VQRIGTHTTDSLCKAVYQSLAVINTKRLQLRSGVLDHDALLYLADCVAPLLSQQQHHWSPTASREVRYGCCWPPPCSPAASWFLIASLITELLALVVALGKLQSRRRTGTVIARNPRLVPANGPRYVSILASCFYTETFPVLVVLARRPFPLPLEPVGRNAGSIRQRHRFVGFSARNSNAAVSPRDTRAARSSALL
jgi:hypothetical protein